MKKVNKNLNQFKDYKKLEIIDCYNINDVNNETKNIANHYKNILLTTGKVNEKNLT